MLKEFLWKLFEKTGDIDSYIFYKEIDFSNNIEMERNAAHEEVAISK